MDDIKVTAEIEVKRLFEMLTSAYALGATNPKKTNALVKEECLDILLRGIGLTK